MPGIASQREVFPINECGIMLEPQLGMSMKEMMDAVKKAEELGFGYLFRSDHLLPTDNRRGIDSVECWTSLGSVAAATTRIKFGPMVSPIGFRNPALLAKMACTLHSYSEGRLQLAVGAGWYESEYKAYGYPFPEFKERLMQFEEALDVMEGMVREGRADFDGKYFTVHSDCLPRPHGKMHLIIGAKSRPIVRLAAQRADEWNLFVLPKEEYLGLRRVFDSAADGRSVEVSETGPFLIGRTQSDLERYAGLMTKKHGMDRSPLEELKLMKARGSPTGTVDEFVADLRMKADSGIEKYYFQALVPENTEMQELLADTLKSGM